MSQSPLMAKLSTAICDRRNANDWPCNSLDFDEEMVKTVLKAAKDAFTYIPGPLGNQVDNNEWNSLLKIVLDNI